MYHKLYQLQHQELVYSKQELVDKKDITQFLTNNDIKFDELGNIYRDYQAYIKINNLQNRLKPKAKPYIPPPQEKPKPKKIKRPHSNSPTKNPKKEKQKKSTNSISKKTNNLSDKDQANFHSLAPPVDHQVSNSFPPEIISYTSAPIKSIPKLEEVNSSSHNVDEISETVQQQQQHEEDVVDIVVPSVMRELIYFIQNKKDDPQLNVQDAIKSICLSHIQKYSLNQEQSIRAINRVMQDFSSMMANHRKDRGSLKESETWSRTPRLGSMKTPSENFSSLNDKNFEAAGGAAKRIELNEYLDEFISHNEEEELKRKKRPLPVEAEAGEYFSEGEEDFKNGDEVNHSKLAGSGIKSNHHLGAPPEASKSSYSSQGQRINNFSKTKSQSSFRSHQLQDENITGRSNKSSKTHEKEQSRSRGAKSKPSTPVKDKKNSKSPQWRYTSPDDYVSVEKKKSADSKSPDQRNTTISPVKVKNLKLKERLGSEIPKGQHWNEKKEFEKHIFIRSGSDLKAPSYHSPLKRELRKKFDDYQRLSKLKVSQMNNSLVEKLSTTVDGLLRSNNKSPSPMTNRSFVYKSGPPEVEQNKLGKKRLNEEWYNEQSRKVFQDRVQNMEKQFSKFLPSKGTTAISCDQLGSSDKVKYYKMLLQRSKLQTVENYRKIPPTIPK